MRVWKVEEQAQLVFRAHATDVSLDCVARINDAWFITGAQDGSLSLWHVSKKKPVATVANAHAVHAAAGGAVPDRPTAAALRGSCSGITALAYVPGTDLVLTGSGDGVVRLWRLARSSRGDVDVPLEASIDELARPSSLVALEPMPVSIPAVGIVNGIDASASGLVAIAVGREHRLGRWWLCRDAKDGVVFAQLPLMQLAAATAAAAGS